MGVVGRALSRSAWRDGVPVLTCEDDRTCTDDIPGWDTLNVFPKVFGAHRFDGQ